VLCSIIYAFFSQDFCPFMIWVRFHFVFNYYQLITVMDAIKFWQFFLLHSSIFYNHFSVTVTHSLIKFLLLENFFIILHLIMFYTFSIFLKHYLHKFSPIYNCVFILGQIQGCTMWINSLGEKFHFQSSIKRELIITHCTRDNSFDLIYETKIRDMGRRFDS